MKARAVAKLLEGSEPAQQSARAWLLRLLVLVGGVTIIFLLTFRVVLPRIYNWSLFVGILATYLLLAYLVLPWLWRVYFHIRLPKNLPARTKDSSGIPDDPVN